jgi:exosortase
MSTVTTVSPQAESASYDQPLIGPRQWGMIAVLAGLVVVLFHDVFYRAYGVSLDGGIETVGYAWTDGDWSHALIVPLISLYFLYQHRHELRAAEYRTSWIGFAVLLIGIASYFLGIFPIRNATVMGWAMILALFGLVWFLCGWQVMKVAWFPIAFLVFAIKISDGAWSSIAFKLQYIAAQAGGVLITLLGMPLGLEAFVRGNVIELERHAQFIGELNVAEACSGLRMLTTFIALGVAVAYLARRPWWSRLTLVALTVPIAIFVNVLRVAVLGLLFPWYPDLATGDFHVFIGMLMLIPALGMFLLVGWILDQLTGSDDDDEPAEKKSKPSSSRGGEQAVAS